MSELCPSHICPTCYHERDRCSHCDAPSSAPASADERLAPADVAELRNDLRRLEAKLAVERAAAKDVCDFAVEHLRRIMAPDRTFADWKAAGDFVAVWTGYRDGG